MVAENANLLLDEFARGMVHGPKSAHSVEYLSLESAFHVRNGFDVNCFDLQSNKTKKTCLMEMLSGMIEWLAHPFMNAFRSSNPADNFQVVFHNVDEGHRCSMDGELKCLARNSTADVDDASASCVQISCTRAKHALIFNMKFDAAARPTCLGTLRRSTW